jgi:hypothetical protein
VKVRIRLLMFAFWDIGVRASEGPASGFCLLAGIRRPEFALRPLCRPSWPLRGPALQRPCHTLPSGAATASYRSSWGQLGTPASAEKVAGEAQGAREPAELWGRMGCSARASPGDTVDSAGSVSSPEFAAITPIAPHSPNGLAPGAAASNGKLRSRAADMAQLPPICGAEADKTGVKRLADR